MKPTSGQLHLGIMRLNDEIAKLGRVIPLLVEPPSSSAEQADADTVESYRDVTAIAVMSIRQWRARSITYPQRREHWSSWDAITRSNIRNCFLPICFICLLRTLSFRTPTRPAAIV